jgi:hypothetical protein
VLISDSALVAGQVSANFLAQCQIRWHGTATRGGWLMTLGSITELPAETPRGRRPCSVDVDDAVL